MLFQYMRPSVQLHFFNMQLQVLSCIVWKLGGSAADELLLVDATGSITRRVVCLRVREGSYALVHPQRDAAVGRFLAAAARGVSAPRMRSDLV